MTKAKKNFGGLLVIASYALAVVVGFLAGTAWVESGGDVVVAVIIADLIATGIIFVISFLFKNSSFYDPFWSIIPMVVVVYLLCQFQSQPFFDRKVLTTVIVIWWGIRLTFNWWLSWGGLKDQDWRYDKLQEDMGKWYWLVSFSGIHVFPTILVLLAMSPYIAIFIEPVKALNWLDIVGFSVMAGAVLIEAVADFQLRRYKRTGNKATMQRGLWAYSRHPNYFGEMGFWWGTFLVGLAANPAYLWTISGAICITILFVFISIPMMEKRMLERRPDYKDVQKKVSMFIPWKK